MPENSPLLKRLVPNGASRGRYCADPRALLAGVFLLCSAPAGADPIQVSFSGVVATVGSSLAGGPIMVGDPVVGSFAYESTLPVPPSSTTGTQVYPDNLLSFSLQLGSYGVSASQPNPGSISVSNDTSLGGTLLDSFSGTGTPLVGQTINGLAPTFARFNLLSTNTVILSSLDPPTVAELNSFLATDGTSLGNVISFDDGTFQDDQVRWTLTDFIATPEPSTAFLLNVGLLVLAMRRRQTR